MTTTREGITVAVGQRWESLDQRDYLRGTITAVTQTQATLKTQTRTLVLAIDKMHKHSTGWKLWHSNAST